MIDRELEKAVEIAMSQWPFDNYCFGGVCGGRMPV